MMGLFLETGLQIIVKVQRVEQRENLLYTTLLCKAVSSKNARSRKELLGTEITVSALKEGIWNQIWRLYPLDSMTTAEGIIEADPKERRTWIW